MRYSLAVTAFFCLATAGRAFAAEAPALPLRAVADIPLGGNTTRLDYESIDPSRHLLFIAHLGDSAVIAFDTKAQGVLARIEGIGKVHGVLVIPELGKVYASATGTNEIVAIDERSFKITARIPGGVYPDGMAYVPELHKLYVSDERGHTETVIDVRTNTRIATIPLGGEVGNTQYDAVSKHVFVNVQTRRQLIEIDPKSDREIARIDLPDAESNHGLLIDAQLRRAFIACEGNGKLLVLDLDTKQIISSFDVGKDPDVLASIGASTRCTSPARPASYLCSGSTRIRPRRSARAYSVRMRMSSQWMRSRTRAIFRSRISMEKPSCGS